MKKLAKLLVAFAMTAGLAACSSNGTTTGDEATTITIWHTFTEDQEDLLEKIADDFESEHENITVEVHGGYDASTYESVVTDAITNEVGPNLVFNFATFAKNFDGTGKLLSFDDYWDFDYADITSAGIVDEATNFSDGKIHAVPIYTAGPVLFVNKAIYDEVGVDIPTTWDEVKETSKKIYEETGVVGLSIDSLTDFAQLLIYQSHQGQIVDLEKNEVVFNDDKTLEWVKWWAEGVQEGYFQVAAQGADGYNSGDLNSGLIASYIGSSAGMPYLDLSDINGDLQVVRVPKMSDKEYENAGLIWNRAAIGFNGTEAQNQAVADFVEYFISRNAEWVEVVNANSPYTEVLEDESYQEFVNSDKALKALGEQVPVSFVAPVFTGSTEMRNQLEELFKGPADPSFDAATALQNAADRTNAAMQAE